MLCFFPLIGVRFNNKGMQIMARLGKIIAVANQKGGVGKTTTSINLAAGLARKRKKILLVDSDPQGNATSGVGVSTLKHPNNHLYHMYTDREPDPEVIKTEVKNLSLIPSNIDLVAAELELISLDRREYKLHTILQPFRDQYDFIIIDCPPSLGLLTLNALTAASSVLIPMQCEYFAMEGLARLINSVRSVKKYFNSDLYIEGLVLTMFDKRNRLTHQVAAEIKKHFSDQLFKTSIPRNVRLSECPSHGQTIIDYDIKSTGAASYIKLSSEFLKRQG